MSGTLKISDAMSGTMKSSLCFMLAALAGCASTAYDKAAVDKVHKVAIVAYTIDYNLDLGAGLKSALMGGEQTMGMTGKIENKIVETDVAKAAYEELVKQLRNTSWKVSSPEAVASSPAVKAFYERRVKVGFLPLQAKHERYERAGIPQYHHIASLKGKTPNELQAMASQLGVDALAFVYVDTNLGHAASIGGFGVGSTKYSSSMIFDLYDPRTDKTILKVTVNGEPTTVEKNPKTFGGNATEAGTFLGIEKASAQLVDKIKAKL